MKEKLEKVARKAKHEIHIETQRTIGIENKLSAEQIKETDLAILAIDVKNSGTECFEGKTIIQVPTYVVVKSLNKLLVKAQEVFKKIIS